MKRYLAVAFALFFAIAPISARAAQRYIITATSPTACTSIAYPAKQLIGVINASTSAQTATISFYDESGATPSCATGDFIYSVVLGASQVQPFPILPYQFGGWLNYGLAYKLSAAATANIVVLYQ